jgi:hypothetical protein
MNFIRSVRERVQHRALHLPLLIALAYLTSSAGAASLRGIVQTGGTTGKTPLPNVNVTLFEATKGLPTVLGRATTNASGQFVIASPNDTSASIFFVTADIDAGVEFVTVLGPKLPPSTTVNELTTVAASYSLAQFYETGVISGNSFGLRIAARINDDVVTPATGESAPILLISPNADETNSLRSTRSLANLLVACVNHPAVTAAFLGLTTSPSFATPHNTAQAMANLARYPGQNVRFIYLLTKSANSYSPALQKIPDAWTINNYKPDFDIDVLSNPGGDGIVIFVGLAAPPTKSH